MYKRPPFDLPPPDVQQKPRGPIDDYDGHRFFVGLMWALGISAAMLGGAWIIIHLIGR